MPTRRHEIQLNAFPMQRGSEIYRKDGDGFKKVDRCG